MEIKEKEIINYVLNELEKRKLLGKRNSARYDTEYMLKQYKEGLPKSILYANKEIEELKRQLKKIKPSAKTSRVALKDSNKTYLYTDETLSTRIEELKQEVMRVQSYMNKLKDILNELEDDEYYPLIECIYFNNWSYERITEEYGWANGTITKHRYRLVDKISVLLLPNRFIQQLET